MSDENHPPTHQVIYDNINDGMRLPLNRAWRRFKKNKHQIGVVGGYLSDVFGLLTGLEREGTLPSLGRSRIHDSLIAALEELSKIDLDSQQDKNALEDLISAIHDAIECGAEFGITLEGHPLGLSKNHWQQRR